MFTKHIGTENSKYEEWFLTESCWKICDPNWYHGILLFFIRTGKIGMSLKGSWVYGEFSIIACLYFPPQIWTQRSLFFFFKYPNISQIPELLYHTLVQTVHNLIGDTFEGWVLSTMKKSGKFGMPNNRQSFSRYHLKNWNGIGVSFGKVLN